MNTIRLIIYLLLFIIVLDLPCVSWYLDQLIFYLILIQFNKNKTYPAVVAEWSKTKISQILDRQTNTLPDSTTLSLLVKSTETADTDGRFQLG